MHGDTRFIDTAGELMKKSDAVIICGDISKGSRRKSAETVLNGIEKYNKNILAVKNIYQNISNHYTFAYYLTLFILLLLVFLFLVVFSIGLQSMGGSVGGGDVIFWSYLYLSPAVYLYFIFYSWGYHRQNIIKLIPLTFLGLSPIFWFFI